MAQARFRRVQGVLARRLVDIYKSDVPDLATVLLEADGFSDLLTRSSYLQEINAADTALVNRVQALRNAVRAALARVAAARAQAAAEVERIAAARDEIARIRAAASARAAALDACASRSAGLAGGGALPHGRLAVPGRGAPAGERRAGRREPAPWASGSTASRSRRTS